MWFPGLEGCIGMVSWLGKHEQDLNEFNDLGSIWDGDFYDFGDLGSIFGFDLCDFADLVPVRVVFFVISLIWGRFGW